MPPLTLVAVVAVSVAGHGSAPQTTSASPAVVVAIRSAEPSHASVTPSYRSDWPRAGAAHGSAAPDPIDWASMYDERAGWAADRQESRRSRRLGAFTNYRTDPYER